MEVLKSIDHLNEKVTHTQSEEVEINVEGRRGGDTLTTPVLTEHPLELFEASGNTVCMGCSIWKGMLGRHLATAELTRL